MTLVLVTIGVDRPRDRLRHGLSGLAALPRPADPAARRLSRPGSSGSIARSRRSIGFVVLALAFVALRDHRDRASLLWPSIGAVLLVGFQAWLGRETVRLNNSGESVTAHLAAAMALVGLLVYILVRAFYPARIGGRGGSQRFTLLAAFGAAGGLRPSPLRVAGDGHVAVVRLPGLAADERLARAAAQRGHVGPRPPPLGRDRRRPDRGGGDRCRVADAAVEHGQSSG